MPSSSIAYIHAQPRVGLGNASPQHGGDTHLVFSALHRMFEAGPQGFEFNPNPKLKCLPSVWPFARYSGLALRTCVCIRQAGSWATCMMATCMHACTMMATCMHACTMHTTRPVLPAGCVASTCVLASNCVRVGHHHRYIGTYYDCYDRSHDMAVILLPPHEVGFACQGEAYCPLLDATTCAWPQGGWRITKLCNNGGGCQVAA